MFSVGKLGGPTWLDRLAAKLSSSPVGAHAALWRPSDHHSIHPWDVDRQKLYAVSARYKSGTSLPALFGFGHRQIQCLEQGNLRREDAFPLHGFSDPAVEALNGVGGVNQPTYRFGIVEKRRQFRPVPFPGQHDMGVLSSPGFLEFGQGHETGFLCWSGVDRAQGAGNLLAVLPGHLASEFLTW